MPAEFAHTTRPSSICNGFYTRRSCQDPLTSPLIAVYEGQMTEIWANGNVSPPSIPCNFSEHYARVSSFTITQEN